MLTQEQNDRLTKVGPGTPCGELLRRYWQALCPVAEITAANPKKRIRILGEDLLLYRSAEGELVCIEEHCIHRSASLFHGFIEEGGIRCCYHGWKYDCSGRCIERPFETAEPPPAARMQTYPVETVGGIVFVYMGPDPSRAPLVPRWDVLVRKDRPKSILVMPVHTCNWLQIQENTVDSVHTYYLHGHMSKVENLATLPIGVFFYRPIVSYDWKTSEWGVEKVLEYGGDRPEVEVRPPLIFPNILRIPEGPDECLHFRVPVDDEHTRIIHVALEPKGGEIVPDDETPFTYEFDPPNFNGDTNLDTFYGQDRMVWETQGVITDRKREVLGASDRGIVLFRRMLFEQIERVERGEEPNVAVVRDPEQNRVIEFSETTQVWWDESKVKAPAG